MADNNTNNVFAAFEMLLEEIEIEVELIKKIELRAVEKRDYDGAGKIKKRVDQVADFREKIASLRKEWETLVGTQRDIAAGEALPARQNKSHRLQRGIRTPESAYYLPILKALDESGGSARLNDVIDKAGQFMKEILKSEDLDQLASDPTMPRWRNTAAWARSDMVKEGLLKSNSPWGVWEMSETGRAFLKKGNS